MKKIAFIILVFIFTLTGCTYQAYERPDLNDNEVWICEDPYFELYWGNEKGFTGKLCIDEIEYNIRHVEDHGSYMFIYEYVEDFHSLFFEEQMEFCLFRGDVNYGKEKMTITVDVDYKNIFDGKKPTMEFIKYNIDEYFKEE